MADLGFAAHGGWPVVLGTLMEGGDLDGDVARAAMAEILDGAASPAQIAAFIVALRMKGETVPELVGMVDALHQGAEHHRPAAVRGEPEISHAPNLLLDGYEARRRWRRMRRRHGEGAPPHTPSFSRPWRANSRHVPCTEHSPHTRLASAASSSVAG